ncbi:hypothetical protein LSAT2_027445 [Lamellibrachia satsuma]|nr:hypothetical protein LSAT2_027445 [Lamellibrachia satsuma]
MGSGSWCFYQKALATGQERGPDQINITLKKNGAEKFVQCLARFDKRFFLLQYIPIMFNPTKRLGPWPPHAYVSPLLGSTERYAATFRQRQQAHSGCNCAAGCQFTRCRCVMAQLRCTDSCRCIAHLGNCVNTINQMETLGLDVTQCKKDVCLMANVFRIKNLATYLQKSVTVQCCGIMLPLRSCIPGHVACPNTPFCHQTYKYSWCNGKMFSDRDGARNHCSICCICKEPNSVHCKTCNICYNPLLLSSYCPCSQAVIRSRHLQRTSSLDSRGSTDRSNKNSPDSATSSATSVGGSAQSPVIISPTTTDESVSADDRRVVASGVERVAVESTQGVESHTDQKVILVKTEQHQDSSKMLKCESNVLRKPAVSIATTDGMPSLPNKQPGSGTQSVVVDATWTGDSLARGQGEAGAVPLGAFLQLVPATDTGQYQTPSAVRRLNGRATQDAFTGRETSRNGFELFCGGRHRSSEAASDCDTTLPTGVRKRDSCGGSSSSGGLGMSSESGSRLPALCESVVVRTPDCEAREINKPKPNASTPLVPMAADVERFRSDAAIVTTPVSARSMNTSTSEYQCSSRKTAGRVCSSNASKRTLSPHRETVVRKKTTKHMAGGRNAYLYTNHCVVAHDGDATRSAKTPERCDCSRASPFSGEQLDTVNDIILPSGWPEHGSCPVEAVLGKPLGTSSPIRRTHQTRPVSPK